MATLGIPISRGLWPLLSSARRAALMRVINEIARKNGLTSLITQFRSFIETGVRTRVLSQSVQMSRMMMGQLNSLFRREILLFRLIRDGAPVVIGLGTRKKL
jgi:hypothetical protein